MKIVKTTSKKQIQEIVDLLESENRVLSVDEASIVSSLKEDQCLIAIDDNDHVVGFIRGIDWGIDPTLKQQIIEVGSWVVDPSQRGKGLGKRLLVEISRYMKAKFHNPLLIDITRKSNHKTCAVLEKLGAKEIALPECIELTPVGVDPDIFRFFDVTDVPD